MKIIHILAGKANPNTLNGVNKVVHSLAEEQTLKGTEVTVCGVANNIIERHKHNYSLLLFKKSKIKFLPPIKLLKFIVRQDKNSIIHLHSAFIGWFPFLAIFLRCYGYQFILTPHGAYTPNNFKKNFGKVIYFYIIESSILIFAKKIHLIGKSEINKITNPFLESKHQLIPNGCNVMSKIEIKSNIELTFGYMGRLQIDHKGLDLFLNGFSLYKKEGGKGIAQLVGDGPDREILKKLAKELKIEEQVKFLGVKFEEEKEMFLKEISYFIHTSRWDVYPTGCLEAASFGAPLLISEETNMGSLVKKYKAGYVLKENTPNEIKKALFFLEDKYFNEGYRGLQDGVEKMVKEELSWNIINKKIVDTIYSN